MKDEGNPSKTGGLFAGRVVRARGRVRVREGEEALKGRKKPANHRIRAWAGGRLVTGLALAPKEKLASGYLMDFLTAKTTTIVKSLA